MCYQFLKNINKVVNEVKILKDGNIMEFAKYYNVIRLVDDMQKKRRNRHISNRSE